MARSNIPVKHWVVLDQGCNSDTTTKNVPVVNAPPVADMTIAADSFCIGSLINFQPNNLGNISSWKLDLGDGNQVSRPFPYKHRYLSSKTYSASLVVTSKEGCSSAPFNKSVIIHPPPPINAGTDKYVRKGNAVTMDASISNPAAYSFLWTPAQYLDKPNTQNPISKPDANVTYILFAVNNQTFCSATDTVKVFLLSDVDIPNTFTPNGDGINDTWDIRFLDQYRNSQIDIYNTAGQVIFRSYGYRAAWDGKRNGAKLPDGTYYYVIDLGDGSKRMTGYVTILR
jgi:gliding motility-associated-like protein